MKKHEVTIKLEDLPVRAEKISNDSLRTIYGGCHDAWHTCKKKSDCCSNTCVPMVLVPVCA
jgi:hypothetical protein